MGGMKREIYYSLLSTSMYCDNLANCLHLFVRSSDLGVRRPESTTTSPIGY